MCTSFVIRGNNGVYVANNEDTFVDTGYIFTNQRNLLKKALVMPPEKGVEWVSRYGSVTMHQNGKEFPSSGMNEKGLVIEQMFLPETKYPEKDDRPAIQELQWIQYMLDTCATVAEVLEKVEQVRITPSMITIHYLLCDREGNVAMVEFIEGTVVVTHEPNPPILSNSSYQRSREYLKEEQQFHATESDYDQNSLIRFTKTAELLSTDLAGKDDMVRESFDVLEQISRSDTIWSIVYDLKQMQMFYKTSHYPTVKRIRFTDLDFSNTQKGIGANMNNEALEFIPYSMDFNKEVIYSLLRDPQFLQIVSSNIDDKMLDFLARYPETMVVSIA